MVMQAKGSDILVARILSEDEDFLTIEIMKDENNTFTLRDGDRFLTLMFVRQEGGDLKAFKPWEVL